MATSDTERGRRLKALDALTLGVALLLAFATVTLVHRATERRVAASEHRRQVALLRSVLGAVEPDNDLVSDAVYVRDPDLLGSTEPLPVHRARRNGRAVAALFEAVAPDGYMGPIRLLIGIDADGHVLGVRVLSHRETAGLGDAIELGRSNWILSFDGRSLVDPPEPGWRVRKDGGEFDQFTGATVTPRAVVTAVHDTLLYFSTHRQEILEAPSVPAPPAAKTR